MMQGLGLPASGWKPLMIRSQRSVWTAVLTVREHLTECLKNAIKPHQVNIGKTKDEMGKGIEVGNSKI